MPSKKFLEKRKEKSLKHPYAEIIITNILKSAFQIFFYNYIDIHTYINVVKEREEGKEGFM